MRQLRGGILLRRDLLRHALGRHVLEQRLENTQLDPGPLRQQSGARRFPIVLDQRLEDSPLLGYAGEYQREWLRVRLVDDVGERSQNRTERSTHRIDETLEGLERSLQRRSSFPGERDDLAPVLRKSVWILRQESQLLNKDGWIGHGGFSFCKRDCDCRIPRESILELMLFFFCFVPHYLVWGNRSRDIASERLRLPKPWELRRHRPVCAQEFVRAGRRTHRHIVQRPGRLYSALKPALDALWRWGRRLGIFALGKERWTMPNGIPHDASRRHGGGNYIRKTKCRIEG